jgi:hypothetical protein
VDRPGAPRLPRGPPRLDASAALPHPTLPSPPRPAPPPSLIAVPSASPFLPHRRALCIAVPSASPFPPHRRALRRYVGGAEHATLHLLYARFWHLVWKELGLVQCEEPFLNMVHQVLVRESR